MSTARNGSIEYARFLGALAIIWFHLHLAFDETALSALQLFVMLQVYFGISRPLPPQARRILIPWLLWSSLYGTAKLAQAILEGTSIAAEFEPWMLLTGVAIHLWYLPFSFLAIWAGRAVFKRLSWPVLYGIGAVLSLICVWAANTQTLPIPLAQWATVTPAVVAALCILGPGDRMLTIGLVLAAGAILTFAVGWDIGAWQTLVATGVLALAFAVPLPSTPLSRMGSELSFGIYLIHPAVYAVLLYGMPGETVLMFLAVSALTIAATWVLRRVAPILV